MGNKPVEEQICEIMEYFRSRRLRHKVDHPETILSDSVPDELTRFAEAKAIYEIVRTDLLGQKARQ
jgi:hypothetical protein